MNHTTHINILVNTPNLDVMVLTRFEAQLIHLLLASYSEISDKGHSERGQTSQQRTS